MKRGQILIKILELLHEQAMSQVDFFSAVLVSGYGASAGQIEYEYQKRRKFASQKELQVEDFKDKKLQLQNKHYEVKDKQPHQIIISFDIPEKFRRKRDWLREVIQNLGFKMVHKSVWVGNIKLPEQLIFDLERVNILEFIEIFEVTKTGTLKKVDK